MGEEKALARVDFGDGRALEAVLGDLLKERTDGIVNAANGHLAHGGGVAAAIARAAGRALEDDGRRIIAARGPLAAGEAALTTAGKLPFKGVIHAVGPRQGEGDEEAKLARALVSAFDIAAREGWSSVSFPAVSSGIFGVPADVCARAYIAAAREFFSRRTSVQRLRLVLMAGPVADAVRKAWAA